MKFWVLGNSDAWGFDVAFKQVIVQEAQVCVKDSFNF